MSARDRYVPAPAYGATIRKVDGDQWGLILERRLRHAPALVWEAIVDPSQLREWAPFDADVRMDVAGAAVRLTTVGAPTPQTSPTVVMRAEPPSLLVYDWGGNTMRWELEPAEGGTRLTLWTSIDRRYIAMGAAGWHVCFDVLDHHLAGDPLGRMAGMATMQLEGWHRLHKEYAQAFGLKGGE